MARKSGRSSWIKISVLTLRGTIGGVLPLRNHLRFYWARFLASVVFRAWHLSSRASNLEHVTSPSAPGNELGIARCTIDLPWRMAILVSGQRRGVCA